MGDHEGITGDREDYGRPRGTGDSEGITATARDDGRPRGITGTARITATARDYGRPRGINGRPQDRATVRRGITGDREKNTGDLQDDGRPRGDYGAARNYGRPRGDYGRPQGSPLLLDLFKLLDIQHKYCGAAHLFFDRCRNMHLSRLHDWW